MHLRKVVQVLLCGCLLSSLAVEEVLPTTIDAETLVPVDQFPRVPEGDVEGFFDLQDDVVSCTIQDFCFPPQGLVMLGPGMLCNG